MEKGKRGQSGRKATVGDTGLASPSTLFSLTPDA
jgi:hypothetical protein